MSAVIINIDDLEFVWHSASDGFLSGVDFKVWLANNVIALREQNAEQARRLEEARELISDWESTFFEVPPIPEEIKRVRAWLAANAPQAEQEQAG